MQDDPKAMTPAQQELMDDLFRSWSMAYMQLFTSQFRSDDPREEAAVIQEWKEEWSTYLSWSRVSPRQIKWAIQACKERFPRGAPVQGEFVALCRTHQPIKDPALPAPKSEVSPARLEQVRAAAAAPKPSDDPSWRRSFWDKPGSPVAADKLVQWATTGDPRALAHKEAAIAGGYLDANGKWSGLRD